ncbi:MAG: phage tail protein [Pseudomonadota bacterium]
MKKLESLRIHLLSIPGELIDDPENLSTRAERGTVYSHASGTNRHFELRYRAEVLVMNYSGDPDRLWFWVLQWLAVNQPDHAPEAVSFNADRLNDQSSDVLISFDLTETVKVEETPEGVRLHHCSEPGIEPELLPANPWSLYLDHRGESTKVTEWLQDG